MMTKILVCNPCFYSIQYEINPWMNKNNLANTSLAADQWASLVRLLEHVGVEVVHMSGRPNLPDIVFTANAAVCGKSSVLLSNFKHPERQLEKEIYKEWFESNGYSCEELPSELTFEGAGDVLKRCSDHAELFLGHGFRTEEAVYSSSDWNLRHPDTIFYKMKLIDPYFYHLDTCFCPLPGDYALIYPEAFEEETVAQLGPVLLKVPEDEARKFACNAVSVNNCVIIPSGCPETRKTLERAGYEVFDTDMSEYIKAGGACKCLTLKLEQMQ